MEYYLIYDPSAGYNIYSKEELEYMSLEDCCIEYYGSLEECVIYLENI